MVTPNTPIYPQAIDNPVEGSESCLADLRDRMLRELEQFLSSGLTRGDRAWRISRIQSQDTHCKSQIAG